MTEYNTSPLPFLLVLLFLFVFFLIALPAILGEESGRDFDCEDYNATEIAGVCVMSPEERMTIIVVNG